MEAGGPPGRGSSRHGHYRFADVMVDTGAHVLSRGGAVCQLEPKAFAVLVVLLEHAGQLVERDELLDRVWGHRHVTPGVLTRAIAQLRTALDDDAHQPRFIQTQHALGYRFIAEVEHEPAVSSNRSVLGDAAASLSPPLSAEVVPAELPLSPLQSPESDAASPSAMQSDSGHARRGWAWALALVLLVLGWWAFSRRDVPPRAVEASIAVLPFTTLSDDREDQYFAEGLAAEMHSALAGIHGLRVAAWMLPSARVADEDVMELGKRLGVATVLDASVRRADERVRISARLSDTRSGYTLWSHTYERALADVFATQNDIAQEVAAALVGVMPDDGEGLRRRLQPTRSVAAFDAYLRGLQALMQGGDDREAAAAHFQQALSSDSGFARAQAGLCRVESWRFEYSRNANAFDNARLACLRAENMDATIGEVALALGDLYRVKGDAKKAANYYQRIEHDPALRPKALIGLARLDAAAQRIDQALERFRQALESSPGNATIYANMGYQQYLAGRVADAVQSLQKATELDPGDAYNWSLYGSLLMMAGDNGRAEEALQRSLAIEPVDLVLSNLGTLKYQRGQYAAAADLYRQASQLNPGHFQIWGNLGDALLADPATEADAVEAFRRAAELTRDAIEIRPDDAVALAALGWYRANLGERQAALGLVERTKSLPGEKAEVAYYNAETFAVLGDLEQARRWLDAARDAGIADIRISSNVIFKRNGLLDSTVEQRQ